MEYTIWDAADVKAQLAAHELTPNKALSQNFCVDATALMRIAAAAGVHGADVVEVGPGLGALTRALLSAGAQRIIAVEKDVHLADILRKTLPDPRLTVLTADFLEADIPALLEGAPFAACGNLPYGATASIVERLLTLRPRSMTLMVQREAAARFFAPPCTRAYGPLPAACALYYDAARVADVPRSAYWPQPEVDSAVVRLSAKQNAPAHAPDAFLSLLKAAFAMRRKTLANNLKGYTGFGAACRACGIEPGSRAESLGPERLYALYAALRASGQP